MTKERGFGKNRLSRIDAFRMVTEQRLTRLVGDGKLAAIPGKFRMTGDVLPALMRR